MTILGLFCSTPKVLGPESLLNSDIACGEALLQVVGGVCCSTPELQTIHRSPEFISTQTPRCHGIVWQAQVAMNSGHHASANGGY
jgi:hypothetical protein